MSNDSSNSHDVARQRTMSDIEKFKEELKGICDYDQLAVLMIGGAEQLVGEVEDGTHNDFVGKRVVLKNPKRYMRLQKVAQNGSSVSIDYFIGSLDGVEHDGSKLQVIPVAGYWIKELGPFSQVNFLKILVGFFNHQKINKAMAAGLALPASLMGGQGGKG